MLYRTVKSTCICLDLIIPCSWTLIGGGQQPRPKREEALWPRVEQSHKRPARGEPETNTYPKGESTNHTPELLISYDACVSLS